MTYEQLEKAAREFSRLIGENPDEIVEVSGPRLNPGELNESVDYRPRWTQHIFKIKEHYLLTKAIRKYD